MDRILFVTGVSALLASLKYRWNKTKIRCNVFDISDLQILKYLQIKPSFLAVLGRWSYRDGEALIIIQYDSMGEDSISSILNNATLQPIHQNDVYYTFKGNLNPFNHLKVTLIYPASEKHILKYSSQQNLMISETKKMYENVTSKHIAAQPISKIQWVYNILEGLDEVDRILYKDADPHDGFVLLPDTKWGPPWDVNFMYYLAICNDRSIRSLRDLTKDHIPLLLNIKNKSLEVIRKKHDIEKHRVRIFVHYQPTYYHFHVHITHVELDTGAVVGKAVLLDEIIYKLSVLPNYYQEATLVYSVGSVRYENLIEKLLKEEEQ